VRRGLRRGLRYRFLISRGRPTGVDSCPRVADCLAAYGVGVHDPGLRGHGSCWFGWSLSQGHRRRSHLVVGGVIHVSCRAVFG
jgi:hypothetical protein